MESTAQPLPYALEGGEPSSGEPGSPDALPAVPTEENGAGAVAAAAEASARPGPGGADVPPDGDRGTADQADPAPVEPADRPEAVGAAMPDPPVPLGVAVESTGRPAVDALLERLADVDHLGVAGHLGVYEDVHSGLRDALTALDQAPGPPPPDTPHDSRS